MKDYQSLEGLSRQERKASEEETKPTPGIEKSLSARSSKDKIPSQNMVLIFLLL